MGMTIEEQAAQLRRRKIIFLLIGVFVLGTLVAQAIAGSRADERVAELQQDVEASFGEMTSEELRSDWPDVVGPGDAVPGLLESFTTEGGATPSSVAFDVTSIQAFYPFDYFNGRRCVRAEWTDDGLTTEPSDGQDC